LSVHGIVKDWNDLTSDTSYMSYSAAVLSLNYFDFGFVRRGLGGTVVYLLGTNRLSATAVFHVLSSICLSVVASVVFARMRRPPLQVISFAVLLIALTLRWTQDLGRTDVLMAALIALTAIAFRKPLIACSLVAVGLFIHEVSVIYGIPLLGALWLDQGRWREMSIKPSLGGGAVLLAALALYASLGLMPHAAPEEMVDVVRNVMPQRSWAREQVDIAIYFAVSELRGIRTAICQNAIDPTYSLHLMTGLLTIGSFIVALKDKYGPSIYTALLVSVPSFIFLGVIATDISRWANLAAFNVWLLCAMSSGERGCSRGFADPVKLLIAALIVPLICIHKWPAVHFFAPMPAVDHVIQKLGGPRPPLEALPRCDPGWRAVLGDPTDQR
jgi:hypothetical protein